MNRGRENRKAPVAAAEQAWLFWPLLESLSQLSPENAARRELSQLAGKPRECFRWRPDVQLIGVAGPAA